MESRERQAFVERLAAENRRFYGTPDGRGTLRAFELTFEHRWIYLFELVQNALDAGARSIAFRLMENGAALEFQHDGPSPLEDKDVEGLSKIFRSTKGASSVGFMGIGFKSVFGRFREAQISGWGWTFRYDVPQVVGEAYGDVQPDLLGAVVPIWDDAIPEPEAGFTTRFELRRRVDAEVDLRSDFANLVPEDDRTPLAILAAAGLERLELDGQVWELGIHSEPDGSLEATALSAGGNLLWQLFPVRFVPSPRAIARFLEHRRIQPAQAERDRVYAEAARERQVLGVLPLDNEGLPNPPSRGRIYATLPTEVTLPFGLHVNADWLLNISRTGLREIEDNAWQRDIVDRIADVLGRFLGWVSRRCSNPDAAEAAFAALDLPSSEQRSRFETLLLEETWLARLRAELEGAAVLPVWTEQSGRVSFVKASEVINPPDPLAEAFEEKPALLPPVLMQGPVLARSVLGQGARALLEHAGVLAEMKPADLERSWRGGLEGWWQALAGEESDRRDLLFRLWGAVEKLTAGETWQGIRLPCVRTQSHEWLPVEEAAFFNEALPSEREPGGREVRRLIASFLPDSGRCIPDGWMGALRQAAAKEPAWGHLSRASSWIGRRGQSIDLRKAVEAAVKRLAESPTPDWSVLVSLGHWAMHRQTRPDLLTHVLAESESGPRCVGTREALVADPYVERGATRRRLFPGSPAISAAYVEGDPNGKDAHEWRVFFEKAGAHGTLRVGPVEAHFNRHQRGAVAEFLGVDLVGESNKDGFGVLDFEIDPDVPEPNSPEEIRAALAPWLEDGFSALRGQGRRKANYFYYGPVNRIGVRSSSWVVKLSHLAWVPCRDGQLRPPRDVLPRPDPAREGVPVAQLSPDLLLALQEEGLAFGAAIPEAPALRRLLALGSRLDAEDLATLLREVREQVATDEDRRHFERAVAQLALPSTDGRRVPVDRVVRRTGGRLRGALGGWILALGEVHESLRAELEHPQFPHEFPETTTGEQALLYLRDVWRRARSSPERLANEVRDVLPLAYAYCLEDVASNAHLRDRWEQSLPEAAVFAEREWIVLTGAEEPVYFDDVEDRRFFPSGARLRTVTGGHLGNSPEQQLRTATTLGLRPLSSVAEMEWRASGTLPATDWILRFELIRELLHRARGWERTEGREDADAEPRKGLRLSRVAEFELTVKVGGATPARVPVNARLHSEVLTVAGTPIRFASDAAKELLRGFSFRQRGDLAADLTGMLTAIDEASDFAVAVDKFVRSFVPGFEVPPEFRLTPPGDGRPADEDEPEAAGGVGRDGEEELRPREGGDSNDPDESGGSFDRDRALARQKALGEKLKKALKGEIDLEDEDAESEDDKGQGGDGDGELGDEIYRDVAARYERQFGRNAELGDPHQTGWDLRSIDPETGSERLIEVKGKGCPWTDDEVVELSRAQVHKAFAALDGHATGKWYLYVVERAGKGIFRVLPIENPVRLARKWILRGGGWSAVAEEPREMVLGSADPHGREEQ